MYAPLTIYSSSIEIERKRVLPEPARVLVRRGQIVTAGEAIAESLISTDHFLLDAARALGISVERASAQIQCKTGQQVAVGDLLAGPIGLGRRVLRAPQDGKVVLVRSGKILLERKGDPIHIRAGLPGEVVDLLPEAGAVIKNVGGLVQAVWGNDRIGSGTLVLCGYEPDSVAEPAILETIVLPSIIVAGSLQNSEFFKQTSNQLIQGVILGSLSPILADAARQAPWPVLVVDGFGSMPMNQAAWQVLSELAGQTAAVNAQPWERRSGCRPEVVIPATQSLPTTKPARAELFTPGQRVRVTGLFKPGGTGILIDLVGQSRFESGCVVDAARLQLDEGEQALVPLANLERIG